MAMDKNEKIVLFKKVPKLTPSEMLHIDNRIEFVENQIVERQKVLWRDYVTVEEARIWADEDDKDANKAAEQIVQSAIPNMKSLKLEIKALQKVLLGLKAEKAKSEYDQPEA